MLPRGPSEAAARRKAVEDLLESTKDRVRCRPNALSEPGTLPRAGWKAANDGPAIVELMDQISSHQVFLGTRAATDDAALLEQHNIVATMSVGTAPQPVKADVMSKLCVRIGDMLTEPLLPHLLKAFKFIEDALQDGAVLIHAEDEDDTEAGSTAVVVAWLMAKHSVPWSEAPAAVQAERPSAQLNANFEKQVRSERIERASLAFFAVLSFLILAGLGHD